VTDRASGFTNKFGPFPFVDATEVLSGYGFLPFCIGAGLLPFSGMIPLPLRAPFTDNVLPFREDLWSQLLALDRPFVIELRLPSRSISPLT
jgi:hypothetical protein